MLSLAEQKKSVSAVRPESQTFSSVWSYKKLADKY